MSALDDKLKEIFKEQYEPILNNADEWLPLVKQAIADEVLPLVNQMAGLVNNVLNQPTMEYLEKPDYHFDEEPQKLDDKLKEIRIKRGNCNHLLFHEDIKAIKQCFKDAGYRPPMQMHDRGDGVKYSDPVMTGQEWLSKFEKEFDALSPNATDYQVYKAAKKAAGLTDE